MWFVGVLSNVDYYQAIENLDVAPNLLKGDRTVNLLESEHNNCSLDSKRARENEAWSNAIK